MDYPLADDVQPLSRFLHATAWTPVVGTYMFPLRYFGHEQSRDPNDYLEVVRVIKTLPRQVAITRGSGMFVRNPGVQPTLLVDEVVQLLNMVLCELTLMGRGHSAPVSESDLEGGRLIGRHATIVGGAGRGPHSVYSGRKFGTHVLLSSLPTDASRPHEPPRWYWPPNNFWSGLNPKDLDLIEPMTNALLLNKVSQNLPVLVVAAVHHFESWNITETIIAAWIVCEQVLSAFWKLHVAQLGTGARSRRLADTRTYSASVRLEVLKSAGAIGDETYERFHEARTARNKLAHESIADYQGAVAAMKALDAALAWTGVSPDQSLLHSRRGWWQLDRARGDPGRLAPLYPWNGPHSAIDPEIDFQ